MPDFVDLVPLQLQAGTLYISIPYNTILHLCCCGCGNKVALPLSPAGWAMTYDGESVSVSPSIGNSSLPCQSHYWIRKGHVAWLPPMSDAQTASARARDRADQVAFEEYLRVADRLTEGRMPSRAIISRWLRALRRFY